MGNLLCPILTGACIAPPYKCSSFVSIMGGGGGSVDIQPRG